MPAAASKGVSRYLQIPYGKRSRMSPPLSAAAGAALTTKKASAWEGEGVLPGYLVAKGDRDAAGIQFPPQAETGSRMGMLQWARPALLLRNNI